MSSDRSKTKVPKVLQLYICKNDMGFVVTNKELSYRDKTVMQVVQHRALLVLDDVVVPSCQLSKFSCILIEIEGDGLCRCAIKTSSE